MLHYVILFKAQTQQYHQWPNMWNNLIGHLLQEKKIINNLRNFKNYEF